MLLLYQDNINATLCPLAHLIGTVIIQAIRTLTEQIRYKQH